MERTGLPATPHILHLLRPRPLLPILLHVAVCMQLWSHQHFQVIVDGEPAAGRLGKGQAAGAGRKEGAGLSATPQMLLLLLLSAAAAPARVR